MAQVQNNEKTEKNWFAKWYLKCQMVKRVVTVLGSGATFVIFQWYRVQMTPKTILRGCII